MSKQVTLGKFFNKPSSAKASPPLKRPVPADDGEDSDWGESEVDEAEVQEVEEEDVAEEEGEKEHENLADIFTRDYSGKRKSEAESTWKDGQAVPYAAVADTFGKIEKTTKRLEITEHLTTFFVKVIDRSPDDLLKVVYLCINRLCPDYEGLELGIGESLLVKAISQSTGRSVFKVKEDLKCTGDLGKVAQESRGKQPTMFKSAPLTVPFVFKHLKEIAATGGNKSQDKKIGIIKKLLASCVGEEPKYLIRSLEGKLRIGLAERTVVVALAQACVIAEQKKSGKRASKEALAQLLVDGSTTVKAVYSELPSYDLVVPALLKYGLSHLKEHCRLTPGVPLKPMLAKPTKAITEVLDRFEGRKFTCEYKYDGERAQIHRLDDGSIRVFSRNSEDMSVKYPDLVEQLPRCVAEGVQSFVLDAEAVAWEKSIKDDKTNEVKPGRLLPFQELSRRKRKDVKAEDVTVRVKILGFDLLFLNGEPLLAKSLEERRKLLFSSFHAVEDEFAFAESRDAISVEEIQAFLDAAMAIGTEGLMVKLLDGEGSTYEPSRRTINWLKLKKDYLTGTGDSLDLVVIGGYYGKGKRTSVYGAFLLACYDPDSETYQSICKIGTGFSEADLEAHYKTLKELEVSQKKGYYDVGDAKPDVYFEPKVVWEVLTADLSRSPVYTAAKGLVGDRGISLRFPRFIRIRDDKSPEDATTPMQVADFYRAQVSAGPPAAKRRKIGGDGDDDEDIY